MPVKLYLGCAMPPFHEQHYELFPDLDSWTWVDKYIEHPQIKNWDATNLEEVEDESVDHIYASHLLEHIEHTRILAVLSHWHDKLKTGGKLTINVPDMGWVAREVIKYDKGAVLDGYYNVWDGEHGLMSIVYGSQSHDGEYHKSGFTERSLEILLKNFAGFTIRHEFDGHDMGVLLAEATK